MQIQTQTIKTELTLNGKKVVIGHQFLEDIVRDIPDTKENQGIFKILASSDNPDVRESLTRVENIGKKSIYKLLNDSNQEVINGVLSNSALAKYINDKTLIK